MSATNFLSKAHLNTFLDSNDPFERILKEYLANPSKVFKTEGILHDETHDTYQLYKCFVEMHIEQLVEPHLNCDHMTHKVYEMLRNLPTDVYNALITVFIEVSLSNYLREALKRGIIANINMMVCKNKVVRNRRVKEKDRMMAENLNYYYNVGGDIGPYVTFFGLDLPRYNS